MANGHENKSIVMNYFTSFIKKYREEQDGRDPSNEPIGGHIRQHRSTKSEPVNIQVREIILDQHPSIHVHTKSSEKQIDRPIRSQSVSSLSRQLQGSLIVTQWLPNQSHVANDQEKQNKRSYNRYIEYKTPRRIVQVEIIRLPIIKMDPRNYSKLSIESIRLDLLHASDLCCRI